jgi:myo-inositol-1-phosphate synthase
MAKKVRVAIAGVGNCCSSLVQGVSFYRNNQDDTIPGIMHASIGGYRIKDIEFVAAFDVDRRKVGKKLAEAIFEQPNCTIIFEKDIKPEVGNPEVMMGNLLDGVAAHMANYSEEEAFRPLDGPPVDVVQILKDTKADVLLNYMPVGSEQAAKFYAQCCLDAKVAMVNCMPVFIASNPEWAAKFKEAGLPIIGDDIKSQFGATLLHRVIARTMEERGYTIKRTYQLNVGGNTDFLNMTDRSRLESKKISKTQSVTSQIPHEMMKQDIHVGPSDYVPFLKDQKKCFVRVEAVGFGGAPLDFECQMLVVDSPNSGGITIDAVRYCKTARDRGYEGPVIIPSAYLMKSPPVQMHDEKARQMCDDFAAEPRPYSDPEVAQAVGEWRDKVKG